MEFEGNIVIEFSNNTPSLIQQKFMQMKVLRNFYFLKGNEKPETTYADRNGKYHGSNRNSSC